MGIEVMIAAASFAVSAVSAVQQMNAQEDAADAQKKAGNEQRAIQAQQAANERRAQIREERIKRARIMQASSNTGVMGSAGELGAVGGLATQFAANQGSNLGNIMHANNISNFQQDAANAMGEANNWAAIGGLSRSIFSMSSSSLFSPNSTSLFQAPVETRTLQTK